jgi:hypothetical protein
LAKANHNRLRVYVFSDAKPVNAVAWKGWADGSRGPSYLLSIARNQARGGVSFQGTRGIARLAWARPRRGGSEADQQDRVS